MTRLLLRLGVVAVMAAIVVATAVPAFALTPNPSQTNDDCTRFSDGLTDICRGGGGSGGGGGGGGQGQNFQVDHGTGEYTLRGGFGSGGSDFGGSGSGGGIGGSYVCEGDFDTGASECTPRND